LNSGLRRALECDDIKVAKYLLKNGGQLTIDPIYSVESIIIGIKQGCFFSKESVEIFNVWNSDESNTFNAKKTDRIKFLYNNSAKIKYGQFFLNKDDLKAIDIAEDEIIELFDYIDIQEV